MGGGTALIPLLTLVCGIPQAVAQGINLAAFLPMSFFALSVHRRRGLVRREGLCGLMGFSLLFSFLFSLLAGCLPARALSSGFGIFLIGCALRQLRSVHPPEKG